jgi:Ca2+-binding RTX toxin-like protein
MFGKAAGWGGNLNLSALNGTDGFRLAGVAAGDQAGISVSRVGDMNGDSLNDLIVGAPNADPNGSYSGASYVVFGRAAGWGASLNVSALDGTDGVRLAGVAAFDDAGGSVSGAGDVNGDGFDDLIVGAYGADPNGISTAGASYVVFGGNFTGAVTFLGTSGADTLTGTAAAERFVGGQGDDTLIGGGGADNLVGGSGNDIFVYNATGDTGITAGTRDTIDSFDNPGATSGDRIDVSTIDAIAGGSDNAFSGALIADGAPFTADGQIRATSANGGTDTILEFNTAGGSGSAAEFQIYVVGVAPDAWTSADFVL